MQLVTLNQLEAWFCLSAIRWSHPGLMGVNGTSTVFYMSILLRDLFWLLSLQKSRFTKVKRGTW